MRRSQLWPNTEVMSTVRVLRLCDRLSSRKRERTERDREQEVTGQDSRGQELHSPPAMNERPTVGGVEPQPHSQEPCRTLCHPLSGLTNRLILMVLN